MLPLTIPSYQGTLHVMNLFLVVAWLMFSFLFWRGLRRWGIDEDRIFDLTFYASIVAFIAARIGFIVTHLEIFAGKSVLLMAALWISPGLSWLAGLIGGIATLILLSRVYKVRLGLVLDTLAVSFPLPIIVGEVGSLFTGMEVGLVTRLPWAIRFGKDMTTRHPVQFYEMIAVLLLLIVMTRMSSRAALKKWAYGVVGVWFLLLYSSLSFGLEFVKESRVYWGNLHANQWVLIGIFAESIGVLYIRGGGRERMRPVFATLADRTSRIRKGVYAVISRKNTQGAEKTS